MTEFPEGEIYGKRIFKTTVGGREMTVETGAYCGQSNGSCIVRCGDTVVMVNATMSKAPRDGMDFFPLSVDYEEKMYAIGKSPADLRRERAEQATRLSSRRVLSTVLFVRFSQRDFTTTSRLSQRFCRLTPTFRRKYSV